jgi:mannose-1-phosphate guanylyltransferase
MILPVILSGGSGTRLWPVSREASPKPFMKVGDGLSLLQSTFDRAKSVAGTGEVVTVTNREYCHKTRDEYGPAGATGTFILEPAGRNTAPAIAVAALHAAESQGEGCVMLVMAADHLIQDPKAFAADVASAEKIALAGRLVTFGISPVRPETGYGYIEVGNPLDALPGFDVARFVEKPYLEVAEKYVSSGYYLWNCGIFCFTVRAFLDALGNVQPGLLEAARACWSASRARVDPSARIVDLDAASFEQLPDISVDFAVMERARNVAVVKAAFGWSDIGSWSAIHDALGSDASGNTVVGDAILMDVERTYVQSEDRVVAAVGVKNLIVVDTPDALLVADRDHAQDVKKVVEKLRAREHETTKLHRTASRPWGSYTILDQGNGFKIKRIVVKPGRSLSLQMHHHRSEHWVVVSGTATVTREGEEVSLAPNESTYIRIGQRHRLRNPGKIDLVIIEVQCGQYLGEDDIVRFEDNYGRA